MKILALDTSRKISTVAFLDTDNHHTYATAYEEKNNEGLLPMIDAVLKEVGVPLKAIDRLGVCLGPGSFTGLRIGVTTMKSFAQMAHIPVFGVGIFDVMHQASQAEGIPMLDARGGRVYYDDQGKATIGEYDALSINQPIVFAEDAYARQVEDAAVLSEDINVAAVIAEIVAQKDDEGDWRHVFPEYVGVSQAERNLKGKA